MLVVRAQPTEFHPVGRGSLGILSEEQLAGLTFPSMGDPAAREVERSSSRGEAAMVGRSDHADRITAFYILYLITHGDKGSHPSWNSLISKLPDLFKPDVARDAINFGFSLSKHFVK